jgi:hypothetical protein
MSKKNPSAPAEGFLPVEDLDAIHEAKLNHDEATRLVADWAQVLSDRATPGAPRGPFVVAAKDMRALRAALKRRAETKSVALDAIRAVAAKIAPEGRS